MSVCGGRNRREAQTEGETPAVSDTEANLKSFCKYVLSKRKMRTVLGQPKGRACWQMVPGKPLFVMDFCKVFTAAVRCPLNSYQ